jgi:hypothetical protein
MWFCFFTHLPKALNPLKSKKEHAVDWGQSRTSGRICKVEPRFFTPLKAIIEDEKLERPCISCSEASGLAPGYSYEPAVQDF